MTTLNSTKEREERGKIQQKEGEKDSEGNIETTRE
jgi:hypothetical protein